MSAEEYYELATDETRSGCLMLIDTLLEKEIGIGTDYPYGPQPEGTCLISREFKNTIGAELNEPIYL